VEESLVATGNPIGAADAGICSMTNTPANSAEDSRQREMIALVVLANTYVHLKLDSLRTKLNEVFLGEFLPPRNKGNFVVDGPGPGQFFIQANNAWRRRDVSAQQCAWAVLEILKFCQIDRRHLDPAASDGAALPAFSRSRAQKYKRCRRVSLYCTSRGEARFVGRGISGSSIEAHHDSL
jgi:hypothetical protein